MILFMKDWGYYPDAIIHTKTKNVSALKLADILGRAGVKNNAFFLSLLDPTLEDVDPYSLELTDVEKSKIIKECIFNPWYYFRELAKFPPQGNGKPVPFELHRANVYLIWSFYNHIDAILIAIRQVGKSATWEQLLDYLVWIAGRYLYGVVITNTNKTKLSSLSKIKQQRDLLPKWLTLYDEKLDADNQSYLNCKRVDNTVMFNVFNKTLEGANDLARGQSAAINIFDEFGVSSNSDITIPAALPSGDAKMKVAKEAGAPHGRIYTCTAGRTDTRTGAWAYKFVSDSAVFKDAFYDCVDEEDLIETAKKNSPIAVPRFNGTFNHRQLGRSDQWLKDVIKSNPGSDADIQKDYFNKWINISTESPFTEETLDFIRNQEKTPLLSRTTKDKYIESWYIEESEIDKEMNTSFHIFGLDTSESFGVDANGLTCMNAYTGEVIMTVSVSEADNVAFARYIANLLIKYPNSLLMPERKSSFSTMLDVIFEILSAAGINVFTRVFNKIVQEKNLYPKEVISELLSSRVPSGSVYIKNRKNFGFITTGASRPELYDLQLKPAVNQIGHLIRDKILVSQLTTLEKNGSRICHPVGGHDDQVVSWLLCYWVLRYGRQLKQYGVNIDHILAYVPAREDINRRNNREEELLKLQERKEISRLKALLSDYKDDFTQAKSFAEQMRLEIKIKNISEKIENLEGGSLNIEAFIADVKKQKTKQRQLARKRSLISR